LKIQQTKIWEQKKAIEKIPHSWWYYFTALSFQITYYMQKTLLFLL